MGWQSCENISGAFIRHLDTEGPISIADAVRRYHHVHEKGYEVDEDGRIRSCVDACETSVAFYLERAVIEPADRSALDINEILSLVGMHMCEPNKRLAEDPYFPQYRKWVIEPEKTTGIQAIRTTNDEYTPEFRKWIMESAGVEDLNSLILLEYTLSINDMCDDLDSLFNYWFMKIVWKLTDKAKADRTLIKSFAGVEL